VPLELYKKSMVGMRKHLVVDIYDGREDMSFVSETRGDVNSKRIDPPNMRFEHLTCFIGGTLVLGKLPHVLGSLGQSSGLGFILKTLKRPVPMSLTEWLELIAAHPLSRFLSP
jgi:hypothetical protein